MCTIPVTPLWTQGFEGNTPSPETVCVVDRKKWDTKDTLQHQFTVPEEVKNSERLSCTV